MKIIFMGTPEFAVPILESLIKSAKYKIAAVFTAPPKAKGRGMKLTESPVHILANNHDIRVCTPSSLKTAETQELVASIDADVIIVAAYGFIIPKAILENKKYGCLNIHPSKLPKYRGAAPLQRTIINGDSETEVCIIQMDEGLDTGDVILRQELPIKRKTSLKQLHDATSIIGADLLIKVLDNIDELPRTPQDSDNIVYAHKLTKEEGRVNWKDDAVTVERKVMGMNPWPGVYFSVEGTTVKITDAEALEDEETVSRVNKPETGRVLNNKCDVACGKGILRLLKVKPDGKKEMTGEDFLRGFVKKEQVFS